MDFFAEAKFIITEGNAYFFSKYTLFDIMGDAYFKVLCLMLLPNVPGATYIPEFSTHIFLNHRFFTSKHGFG